MTLLRRVYELFPPRTREALKSLLRTQGHGASYFDAIKARDHALGKKRLDRAAEALLPMLKGAGLTSLRGRACLEFGAGYAPTEALIFYLLGASTVAATDYNPIARLDVLVMAARAADRARVLDLLKPFANGLDLERRLDGLLKGEGAKEEIASAIRYIAPHDMSMRPMPQAFDVIHSVSVFEHLPAALAEPILANLVRSLAPGGHLFTEIDLRDHLDPDRGPLAFLTTGDCYREDDADRRGNRLRRSDWLSLFARQPGLETATVYEKFLPPEALPAQIAPQFQGRDCEDLRVSWLGLSSRLI